MTLIAVLPASTTLLAQLAIPAARALALSIVVGIGLSAFRVKNTSLRLFTWTAVLYAALAMPLLQQILPPLPIPAPAFLLNAVNAKQNQIFGGTMEESSPLQAAERRQNAAHGASRGGELLTHKPQRGERLAATATSLSPASHSINGLLVSSPANSKWPLSPIRWNVIAAGIYLAVTMILFARFFTGLAFTRRLLRASAKIDDPRITQRLAARAANWNLASTPRTAESELISIPVTIGALRSTILLPSAWRDWDDAQIDAVIAHEVSHVARRDALTQRLSLLHRAIFWFSPLSWWLDRCLADLAEQASDEAALSCGADRKHYARILLGFFETLHAAPGRVWWQGVSMAKAGQAEHRVERILAWKGSVAMSLQKSVAVAIVALAAPVVYLAASAQPPQHVSLRSVQSGQDTTPPAPAANRSNTPHSQPSTTAAPASEVPPQTEPTPELQPALAPAMIHGTIRGGVSGIPSPSLAPVAGIGPGVVAPMAPLGPSVPVAVIAPVAPVAAIGQSDSVRSFSGRRFSYHYGYDDEQRFVIVSGKTDSFTMSGSAEDARHVEKLRKQIPGDFIWFQRDEKSYVIRDQPTIDRARKLWEPQEELGKKQEALGKQQEALGKQQEELGAKMQQIRVNVPDLNADLEKLKAELKQLSSGATVDQVGHIQSEIGELQSKIGEIQSHAGDQQGKLGEEMGVLGEQQGKLGEQQGKLGEEQGKLAEQASHQMKQLLDEAITKGTAQPEI